MKEWLKEIIGWGFAIAVLLLIWEYGYRILVFLFLLPTMLLSFFINITIPWFMNLFG